MSSTSNTRDEYRDAERAELATWRNCWSQTLGALAAELGASTVEAGSAFGFQLGAIPTWMLNRVIGPSEGSHPSYNNMVRLGFRVAYERPNWVLEPELA